MALECPACALSLRSHLGDRDDALGGICHVPNAPTLTARQFVAKVGAQLGIEPKIRVAPGTFVPMVREVAEMLYTAERPYIVDHGKFERAFGNIATPHDEAILRTLGWCRAQPEPRS